MNIELINVSILDSIKNDIMNMAKEAGTSVTFEDVLGYRNNVLLNTSLVQDAFKVAKVHAEVSRLKHSYLVRDIASGVVNDDHNIVKENDLRVARDLLKYSELDIERVVRSGLEVSSASSALVISKANILITSHIWQRISSEVAADYNARVDFIDIEDFILGYNIYIEKYPLILVDSFLGDIVSVLLRKLGEIKEVFYVGESDAFYTTDGSVQQTALGIYEIIKEKDPLLAEKTKTYFDKFVG